MARNKDEKPPTKKDFLSGLFEKETVADIEAAEAVQAQYRIYPTGCLHLDCSFSHRDPITGLKGVVARSVVEHYAQQQGFKTGTYEQVGKSILSDEVEEDSRILIIYSEESFMNRWNRIGLTPEQKKRIIALNCFTGSGGVGSIDRAMEKAQLASQDKRLKLAVLDSVAAAALGEQLYTDKGELKDLTDVEKLGMKAVFMQKFIRNFNSLKEEAILWLVNRSMDKIQIGMQGRYNNQHYTQKTTGGRHMEFDANVRIESWTNPIHELVANELTKERSLLGWEVTYELTKNKYCNPTAGRISTGQFFFDEYVDAGFPESIGGVGFDDSNSIIRLGEYLTRHGHIDTNDGITKAGRSHYEIQGHKENGIYNALSYIYNNPEVAKELKFRIYDKSDFLFAPVPKEKKEINLEEIF